MSGIVSISTQTTARLRAPVGPDLTVTYDPDATTLDVIQITQEDGNAIFLTYEMAEALVVSLDGFLGNEEEE